MDTVKLCWIERGEKKRGQKGNGCYSTRFCHGVQSNELIDTFGQTVQKNIDYFACAGKI
jgi:hypothetical protein